MTSTTNQSSIKIKMPSGCAADFDDTTQKMLYVAPTIETAGASRWTNRQCGTTADFRDGTLGCWGHKYRKVGISNVWTIWQW